MHPHTIKLCLPDLKVGASAKHFSRNLYPGLLHTKETLEFFPISTDDPVPTFKSSSPPPLMVSCPLELCKPMGLSKIWLFGSNVCLKTQFLCCGTLDSVCADVRGSEGVDNICKGLLRAERD